MEKAAIEAINKIKDAVKAADFKARLKLLTDKNVDIISDISAEEAVKSVEVAPLITSADVKSALDLGKTAAESVLKVKDTNKAITYTTRLKVVADKALSLKAQLDAAELAALTPAKISSVSAVDGAVTVTFDKKPLTAAILNNFKAS